jgi:2-iminobutanoate/2-iminopropanoate deaminase
MNPRPICPVLFLLAGGLVAADKQLVQPKEFPSGRPFSPGIIVSNGTLYVAGQVGSDPKTGKIPENFEDEVRQTLANIGMILKEAGYDFKDAVSVNVYLTDIDLFQRMNTVYTGFFPEPRPVRTTVAVAKLVGTAKIEITVTAWKEPVAAKGKKRKQP